MRCFVRFGELFGDSDECGPSAGVVVKFVEIDVADLELCLRGFGVFGELLDHSFIISDGFGVVFQTFIGACDFVKCFGGDVKGFVLRIRVIECLVVLIFGTLILNDLAVLPDVGCSAFRLVGVVAGGCECDDGLIMLGGFIPLVLPLIDFSDLVVRALGIFALCIAFDHFEVEGHGSLVAFLLLGPVFLHFFRVFVAHRHQFRFVKSVIGVLKFRAEWDDAHAAWPTADEYRRGEQGEDEEHRG